MDKLVIGKVIKMPCMRRGLCAYPNETVLLTQETLQRLAPTIMGVPVVIEHPNEIITDENINRLQVVGRVADMHYYDQDDSWYAHFVVDDQKGIDLLEDGYGVSTAWFGEKYASGGTFNNVGYDRELLEGRYEHLAIVKNPRYEMAQNPIFMNSITDTLQNDVNAGIVKNEQNIKPQNLNSIKDDSMIGKLFKKLTSREEIKPQDGEEIFVHVNGKDEKLSDVIAEIEMLRANKKNEDEKEEKEKEKKQENGDDEEYDIDGEKVSMSSLKKAWKASKKKNESEEEEKKEKETKENSLEEKEMQERFEKIKEIHVNGVVYKVEDQFLSTRERVELGKKSYGS